MQVVMPVHGSPPKQALLRARLGQDSENELECAAGRERAMREVPVVSRHDAEHAQQVQRRAKHKGLPRDSGPDRCEAGQVSRHKWNGRWIHEIGMFAFEGARHVGAYP
jgi:hypothetical protein